MKKNEEVQTLKNELKDQQRNKRILYSIFTIALAILVLLSIFSPNISEDDKKVFSKIPTTPQQVFKILQVVQKYKEENSFYVYFVFCYTYVFLQSFAIPGPVILSLMSGILFGFYEGYFIVLSCATLGASTCYFLSYTIGRGLIMERFPNKIIWFKKKINENSHNLIWYILFLRVTPFLPNWFINISSPLVGVSFKKFFIGTFIGLMPGNFILIQTSLELNKMDKMGLSLENICWLLVLGCFALIPTLFKPKNDEGFQNVDDKIQ